MSARLRNIAQQTEEIVESGRYVAPGGRIVSVARAVATAREGTVLYGRGPVPVPPGESAGATVIEVTGEDSWRQGLTPPR